MTTTEPMPDESPIEQRRELMRERLDERQRRTYAAVEAKVIGRGGISQVAAATGLARGTIMAGMRELEVKTNEFFACATPAAAGSVLSSGGGRKPLTHKDPTLVVHHGKAALPGCPGVTITPDGGGSNGHRVRLWKLQLGRLAAEAGLDITVCHFPPGTSKWNKIEHRLFSFITMNWRAKPLVSHEVIVSLIAATKTRSGLIV
jgi:Rhodopirellula transposase DDE domain